jgi:hypothetical protein
MHCMNSTHFQICYFEKEKKAFICHFCDASINVILALLFLFFRRVIGMVIYNMWIYIFLTLFLFGIRLQVLYSKFEFIFHNKAGWWICYVIIT